ncbi:InlB B-repeat-containing protein, partial [Clostridium cadaveris]|uniref:InlB B-repeat-containing protein n=1 Tax=Clostridium cadaveris TaxID=1529 RepID=UPI0015B78AB5
MLRKTKRLISFWLVLLMVVSILPMQAFAQEEGESPPSSTVSLEYELKQELREDEKEVHITIAFSSMDEIVLQKVLLPDGKEQTEELDLIDYSVFENGLYSFTVSYLEQEEPKQETIEVNVSVLKQDEKENEDKIPKNLPMDSSDAVRNSEQIFEVGSWTAFKDAVAQINELTGENIVCRILITNSFDLEGVIEIKPKDPLQVIIQPKDGDCTLNFTSNRATIFFNGITCKSDNKRPPSLELNGERFALVLKGADNAPSGRGEAALTFGNTVIGAMKGNVIVENFVMKHGASLGAGISIQRNSDFTMYNGTIRNNKSLKDPTFGGAIAVLENSNFTMLGGIISDNESNIDAYTPGVGWNVYGAGGVGVLRSKARILGGAIIRNSTNGYGGGIGALNSEIELSNVTIQESFAQIMGGGVFSYKSLITLKNQVEIIDNTLGEPPATHPFQLSTKYQPRGGGVYLTDNSTLRLEGTASTIANNLGEIETEEPMVNFNPSDDLALEWDDVESAFPKIEVASSYSAGDKGPTINIAFDEDLLPHLPLLLVKKDNYETSAIPKDIFKMSVDEGLFIRLKFLKDSDGNVIIDRKNSLLISFDPTEGINTLTGDNSTASIDYTFSQNESSAHITLSTPEHLGITAPQFKEFDYWKVEGDSNHYTAGDTFIAYDDVTFIAVWKENKHNLTYDINGGTGNVPAMTKHLKGAVVTLDTTTKPTHDDDNGKKVVFAGWTEAQDTKIYAQGDTLPSRSLQVTMPEADKTVYAVYGYDINGDGQPDVDQDTYLITFD